MMYKYNGMPKIIFKGKVIAKVMGIFHKFLFIFIILYIKYFYEIYLTPTSRFPQSQ